jgi:hypothetical protein
MNNTEIAQCRLRNQGFAAILFKDVKDIVTRFGAVQAQDYAGAKWALGQRLKDATDSMLNQAFNDGSIVRTHLMRPTWHFVSPEDIRWLLKLTAARVHAFNSFMYRNLDLDRATLRKSYAALEKALQGNKQLTRSELAAALENAKVNAEGLRVTYIMMSAELDGIICSGARRGKQFTYALLEERAPQANALTRDESLAELTRRYFTTRGPATVDDFAWWSGLTVSDAKRGVEMIQPRLENEAVNGQTYWFIESKSSVKIKSPTIHLLPNYDEYFIGFKDRSAFGEVMRQTDRKSDDPSLFAHIIFLDGQVIGGWKRTLNKNSVTVEIKPIIPLSTPEREEIDDAAKRFGKFLGLSVNVVDYSSPRLKRHISFR